jgi:hypothetical protein
LAASNIPTAWKKTAIVCRLCRRLKQLQGSAELRRIVRVVCGYRRHDQSVAFEQLAHLRRLLGGFYPVDSQPGEHFHHAIHRHDRHPVNLLKLLIDVISLQQRIDVALPAEVHGRRDRPNLPDRGDQSKPRLRAIRLGLRLASPGDDCQSTERNDQQSILRAAHVPHP